MRRILIVLTLLSAVLASTACTATSSSSRCVNDVCAINLSGEQTIEVSIGSFERDLRVGPIEAAAVTVSARGEQARLAVGESGEVGGLAVRVAAVSGRDVALEIRRT